MFFVKAHWRKGCFHEKACTFPLCIIATLKEYCAGRKMLINTVPSSVYKQPIVDKASNGVYMSSCRYALQTAICLNLIIIAQIGQERRIIMKFDELTVAALCFAAAEVTFAAMIVAMLFI